MEYVELGRTGLRVSVAGLGCGGSSRIGQTRGLSEAESVALVRGCMDLGVNVFDTAAAYGTETIIGKAVGGVPRDSVVVSTKATIRRKDEAVSADAIVASLDASLQRLQLDHVDVFYLHGVRPGDYDRALHDIVPRLLREKDKGKFAHLGVTETPPNDPEQAMLQRAVDDDVWEVAMLGFHMMNQRPRDRVLPKIVAKRIGTMAMFVVRGIFSTPGRAQQEIRRLAAEQRVPQELAESDDPLGFLIHEGGARNVINAAYRYARHTEGLNVILFGTGDIEHARTNIASILDPPLPEADVDRLEALFGSLEGVGLDLPTFMAAR